MPKAVVGHGSIQIQQAVVVGDLNGNGVVDASDALAALKMSADLMKEDLILNVDGQNGVTSNDARLLLKMAAKGTSVPTQRKGVNQPLGKGRDMPLGDESRTGGVTGNSNPERDTDDKTTLTPEKNNDAKRAYQEYIAAYNKLTSLMAKGQGDTPAAQRAYQEYKAAKDKYEATLKNQK
jgi:hypothetical protein